MGSQPPKQSLHSLAAEKEKILRELPTIPAPTHGHHNTQKTLEESSSVKRAARRQELCCSSTRQAFLETWQDTRAPSPASTTFLCSSEALRSLEAAQTHLFT